MSEETAEARTMTCAAIVVAGGQGSRFGSDIPKQLVSLAGYPILHHTLRRFEQAALISKVVVVANPDWYGEIVDTANYALRRTPHHIVHGGDSRNESVAHAVDALSDAADDTPILIHDGVRPFASEELILRVLKALHHFRAVIPVIPSADPLVRVDGNSVESFERRSEVMRGQSPQGFVLGDLRRVFEDGRSFGHFDTLFELLLNDNPGFEIGHVEGEMNNIKITTPIDRMIAGQIIMDTV